jgi:mono/diheme cytochrome c family protein
LRLDATLCHTVTLRFASFLTLSFLLWSAVSDAGQAGARGLTSGEAIYNAGCAGCHGAAGTGAPDTTIGFEKPATFPDFTMCDATTPERDVDWKATIHFGGHGRGFSRIMPSFADELTSAQIDAAIGYLRGFCREKGWPRAELNLPRGIAIEKAFPESETVITTAVSAQHTPDVSHELVYEQRFGPRTQLELAVPFTSHRDEAGTWVRGLGDVAVGLKRVLFANANAIVSAQGEVTLPTGSRADGLGNGVSIVEAFAAYGQILPSNMFVQAQAGTEQPWSTRDVPRALFGRVGVGKSLRQEMGLGRQWSPILELLADRDIEDGAKTNVDLLPQVQVTLNKRQHVRFNLGLQIPVNNTTGRSKQVVFYFLWDWFDGGFLDGWK